VVATIGATHDAVERAIRIVRNKKTDLFIDVSLDGI
jgi:hypothetical protein